MRPGFQTSLADCNEFHLENDPRSFASLRMTLWGLLVSRCRAYREFRCSRSADELFELTMIFYARHALNAAADVNRVGLHVRDCVANVLCTQATGQNQKSRVGDTSLRGGPIARLTRTASDLAVVRIDEYVAIWERCCVFWLEPRIG
jgi:hypothetical protein